MLRWLTGDPMMYAPPCRKSMARAELKPPAFCTSSTGTPDKLDFVKRTPNGTLNVRVARFAHTRWVLTENAGCSAGLRAILTTLRAALARMDARIVPPVVRATRYE